LIHLGWLEQIADLYQSYLQVIWLVSLELRWIYQDIYFHFLILPFEQQLKYRHHQDEYSAELIFE